MFFPEKACTFNKFKFIEWIPASSINCLSINNIQKHLRTWRLETCFNKKELAIKTINNSVRHAPTLIKWDTNLFSRICRLDHFIKQDVNFILVIWSDKDKLLKFFFS